MPLQPATPSPAILGDLLQNLGLPDDGRPIFLYFFRSDCPWCASETPHFASVFARPGHKFLSHVIGIAVGHDSLQLAQAFAHEKEWPYSVWVDEDHQLREAFALTRVPAVVVINGQKLVERTYEGYTEQVSGILEQTLYAAARGVTPPQYSMIGNGCAP